MLPPPKRDCQSSTQIINNKKYGDNIINMSSSPNKRVEYQQIIPHSPVCNNIEYGNSQGRFSSISASYVDTSRSSDEHNIYNDYNMVPSQTVSKNSNVLIQYNVRIKRPILEDRQKNT